MSERTKSMINHPKVAPSRSVTSTAPTSPIPLPKDLDARQPAVPPAGEAQEAPQPDNRLTMGNENNAHKENTNENVEETDLQVQVRDGHNWTQPELERMEYFVKSFTLEELHNILRNKHKCSDEFIILNCATLKKSAQEIILQQRIGKKKDNDDIDGNDTCCGCELHFWCMHSMSHRKHERIKSRNNNAGAHNDYECCECSCCHDHCCNDCYFSRCGGIADLFNFQFDMHILSCVVSEINSDDYDYNFGDSESGGDGGDANRGGRGNFVGGCVCGFVIGFVVFVVIACVSIFRDDVDLIVEALIAWAGLMLAGMITSSSYTQMIPMCARISYRGYCSATRCYRLCCDCNCNCDCDDNTSDNTSGNSSGNTSGNTTANATENTGGGGGNTDIDNDTGGSDGCKVM